MQGNSENIKTVNGDKVNDFVQRNRKAIFSILGVILILFAGVVVYLSLNNFLQKKAIGEVEELNARFIDLRSAFEDETSADVNELLADINAFAKNKNGFAGGRAWSLIAQIQGARKNWSEAETAWKAAAKAAPKSYLGPVALFNAASAMEEQGKLEQAIEFFEECASHSFEYPAAVRAQFSIGRLNEQLGNIPAAIEAYRIVLIRWPNITVWANLAHSRIAALESM